MAPLVSRRRVWLARLWRPNVDAHEEKVRSPAWIYPRSAKLYVDKVEFGHLSLREEIQSFVEKVDRSLMNLDTNTQE